MTNVYHATALEIEQDALGVILRDGLVPEMRPEMYRSHFVDSRHQCIAVAIRNLVDEGTHVSIISVKQKLVELGTLESAGGVGYISSMTSTNSVNAQLGYLLSKIEAYYQKTRLHARLNVLVEDLGSGLRNLDHYTNEMLQLAISDDLRTADCEVLIPISSLSVDVPNWLIEGLITKNSVSVFYGEPKSLKTFLLLRLAYSVATGLAFGESSAQRGQVIYILGEGREQFRTRIAALEQKFGTSLTEGEFVVSKGKIPLRDPEAVARFIAAIDARQMVPSLIVVDTLNRNFGANGNPDTSKDMTEFLAVCDKIRERYGCAVVLVHHTGHAEKYRPRGSSVIEGDVDFQYLVKKASETSCSVIPQRCRDHALPEEFMMNGEPIEVITAEGSTVKSMVLVGRTRIDSSEQESAVGEELQILLRLSNSAELQPSDELLWVRYAAWRKACEDRQISRQRVHRVKDKESRSGRIEISEDGECVRPSPRLRDSLLDGQSVHSAPPNDSRPRTKYPN